MSCDLKFFLRVGSYFFRGSYEYLFNARVTSYFLDVSCKLLFVALLVVMVIFSANLGTP